MHTLSLILHPICTHLKGKCTHLNRKCTHTKGQMHPLIAVVTTGCIDYDLTTTHGIELPRFALFCKKCSLQLKKSCSCRSGQNAPKHGIIGHFERRKIYDESAFRMPRQHLSFAYGRIYFKRYGNKTWHC